MKNSRIPSPPLRRPLQKSGKCGSQSPPPRGEMSRSDDEGSVAYLVSSDEQGEQGEAERVPARKGLGDSPCVTYRMSPCGGRCHGVTERGSAASDQIGIAIGSPPCLRHLPRKGGEGELRIGLCKGEQQDEGEQRELCEETWSDLAFVSPESEVRRPTPRYTAQQHQQYFSLRGALHEPAPDIRQR